jgi:hypothetical protein
MDERPMRIQIKTPAGALTRPEVEALARVPGSVIYKVYDPPFKPTIMKLYVKHCNWDADYIDGHVDGSPGCHIGAWFCQKSCGYLFSNYFHALAYSLQCKNKSKEPA